MVILGSFVCSSFRSFFVLFFCSFLNRFGMLSGGILGAEIGSKYVISLLVGSVGWVGSTSTY